MSSKFKPPEGWVEIDKIKLADYPDLVKSMEKMLNKKFTKEELNRPMFPNMDVDFDLSQLGDDSK